MSSFSQFNPSLPPPPGGFCISVFLIVRSGSNVLVGRIGKPEEWSERWGLDMGHPERWAGLWQMPATFLKLGEHPDDAARRVLWEQLEIGERQVGAPKIFAVSAPSSARPGAVHADLLFVYQVDGDSSVKANPHFSELEYRNPLRLKELAFGRGHDEVLRLMGYEAYSKPLVESGAPAAPSA